MTQCNFPLIDRINARFIEKVFGLKTMCVFEESMLFFENVAYKVDTTQVIPCANQSLKITFNFNQFHSKKSQPNGNRVKWHETSD